MRQAIHLSSRVAVAGSAIGVVGIALVAATPGSPYQPVLPSEPSGPLRWLSDAVGLGSLHGSALAAAGVVAAVVAVGGFLLAVREAWRGSLSLRLVIGLAVSYHVVVLFLPLLFSRDVYSYAAYGRIASVHRANPYVATPIDFPRDPVAPFVGDKWRSTPAVYGPAFTALSATITRAVGTVPGLIVVFRTIAIGASLATLFLVVGLARRMLPDRAPFAAAVFGLNPVVLFQSVGSGHNDLLVALAIAGGLALVTARRELTATAALTLGALVKASAAVPLLLLVVAAVARREPGRRWPALWRHLVLIGGITVAFAAPFLQARDPSLGMAELAHHEGWLAPSRFFRRISDAVGGHPLAVVVRMAFPLALAVALFLISRELVRRGSRLSVAEQGAAWGWGLLFLMLLGPVLLPWYVTWALPLAWLLPRVPRLVALGVSAALSVSQFTVEPERFLHAYHANLWFGHWIVTPGVIALLVWLGVDLLRRVRGGTQLGAEGDEVPAQADQA